jgi:general L-amino acid transport system ATP-binding protein
MNSPILQIEGVHKWYGNFHALTDCSLDVAKGERIVVCGPSGSGKSTLIRCVNEIETIDGGRILFKGTAMDRSAASAKARRHIGMVFQQFNLFPHLSVLDNLVLAPMNVLGVSRKQAEATAMEQLERVRIAAQAHKFPGQMSGGQQQRVAIARALCMAPELMLELAGQGMTMLVVTHEMGFAQQVADRVVFMDGGQILEVQPPEQFFQNPQSERSRAFLGKILRHNV